MIEALKLLISIVRNVIGGNENWFIFGKENVHTRTNIGILQRNVCIRTIIELLVFLLNQL